MITSPITHKTYDPSNSNVVYLSNMIQSKKYLSTIGPDYLLDVLYDNTKNDCLVFVFKRCQETAECYRKWQSHEL
jgi:hypothetical protein